MNDFKLTFNNIIRVASSQGVSLLSGIVVGFVLPKILSVENYGLLKIYTLYATYTSLLHFGFVDGILLKFAGCEYNDLDKTRIRTYTYFFFLFQLIISGTIALASIFMHNSEYMFIMRMLGINMVIINFTTYFQFISQATQRFVEYAAKNFIIAVMKILLVAWLFVVQAAHIYEVTYRLYIIGLNLIDLFILVWYVFTYRELIFGSRKSINEIKEDIFTIFKQGIILTIAYQASHLTFVLDRQFVSVLFSTETYAHYSFAYNIISLIITLVSSLSIVLFPALKRVEVEFLCTYYSRMLSSIAIIAGACMLCFFPFAAFIEWFLPEYILSLEYLKIIFPSLMFNCCISVVMFTFCKVLNLNKIYFKHGCIALGIGAFANYIAFVLFASPEAISYASLLTMAIWFILEGNVIEKKLSMTAKRQFIYIVTLAVGFIFICRLSDTYLIGLLAYLVFYTLITCVIYFQRACNQI